MSWRESVAASMLTWLANGRTGFSSWDFADASRNIMGISEPSVLYWNLRFYTRQVGTTWTATPWIGSDSAHTSDITTAEVDRARSR